MFDLVHDVARPVDWRVIGFMILAALVSAVLFGSRTRYPSYPRQRDLLYTWRSDIRCQAITVQNVLVIAQITVCTLLLVACGALVRTTMVMTAFDIAFIPIA